MKNKDQLFEAIRNILQDNNISVYSLSKITGINRSTLQKALVGARPLTLRQFKILLDSIPISAKENKYLYNCFLETNWEKEHIISNVCILDIFDCISDRLSGKKTQKMPISTNQDIHKKVYTGTNAYDMLNALLHREFTNCTNSNVCFYLPLYKDLINDMIFRFADMIPGQTSISVLFEFTKSSVYNPETNLLTLKTLIPMIIDDEDRFKLHYFYVDDYIYHNHTAPYPYYVILSNKVLLLDLNIENILILDDLDIVEAFRQSHCKAIKDANVLKTTIISLINNIDFLINNHFDEENMYSIGYEPCISSFVPPEMYQELIDENFPNKAGLMNLIESRVKQISDISIKYAIFNKDSLDDFVKTGNILPFVLPNLKKCTLEQRKSILTNIYNAMDDKKIIMRAFSADKINISNNYEFTDIQDNFSFQILLYPKDCDDFKIISINEPIISKAIIRFINDITETHHTFTYERTKALVMESINKLDKMIADNAQKP